MAHWTALHIVSQNTTIYALNLFSSAILTSQYSCHSLIMDNEDALHVQYEKTHTWEIPLNVE